MDLSRAFAAVLYLYYRMNGAAFASESLADWVCDLKVVKWLVSFFASSGESVGGLAHV
ncbi:MAG: hypothetical protein NTW28_00700 [Candidatus Solibacter sp.]|nr:hypothetical protein [Candidatus Solibacter sp.]